jgi:hypothetical protein
MKLGRMILAALAVWIAGSVYTMLTCGWLFNRVYQIPPIIWVKPETMMLPMNMAMSYGLSLIMALISVMVYALLYNGIPGNGYKKGLMYGVITYLVGVLPGISGMPFYMTISWTVVGYWMVNFLVYELIAGFLTGVIYKK